MCGGQSSSLDDRRVEEDERVSEDLIMNSKHSLNDITCTCACCAWPHVLHSTYTCIKNGLIFRALERKVMRVVGPALWELWWHGQCGGCCNNSSNRRKPPRHRCQMGKHCLKGDGKSGRGSCSRPSRHSYNCLLFSRCKYTQFGDQ